MTTIVGPKEKMRPRGGVRRFPLSRGRRRTPKAAESEPSWQADPRAWARWARRNPR